MWTNCCCVTKRRSTILQNSISQSANVPLPAATQRLGNSSVYEPSEKTINDLNANGYQLRHERRSLPDVVITSASMASTKPCILKKPSLQLDSETGRRPTLDVETTARLAEAENVCFDEAAGADATPMKTDYRSKSLGATQLSKQIHGSPQTRASTSNAAHHNDTSMNTNSKKNSLMRLSTLKRFQKHLRKLGSLKLSHSSEKVESDGPEVHPTVFLRRSKESHLLEEEDDLSEPTSVGDCLGQLPPKSVSRSSRLAGYGAGEGIYKSINITDKLNSTHAGTSAAVPRPGGIRRGSLCIFSQVDEPIVTPFAQILASLRRVRANFILLTNVHSSKE
ncbi:Phosphodiesterase [Fasciola gigantica]|uniref:3',5'-cyclic-AMP phosphodiesterase n=1 Tax=Fasciola gigantica TaxID=46835 RepID=A0A504YZV9_FASGI|nr:Phosphodiesterase [Fasciola gigantica]